MPTTDESRPAPRERRTAAVLAQLLTKDMYEDEMVKWKWPNRRRSSRRQQSGTTVAKHSSSSKKRARSSAAKPAVKEENDSAAAGASRSISNNLNGKMISNEKGIPTHIYTAHKPISPVTPVQSPVRPSSDTTIQFQSSVRQKPDGGLMSPPRNTQNCQKVGLVRPLNHEQDGPLNRDQDRPPNSDQDHQTEPLNLSMGESSGSGGAKRRISTTAGNKPYNSLISVTPGDHLGSGGDYAAVIDPPSPDVKCPKPKQVVHPFPKNEDPSSQKCNHQEETPKPVSTSNTQESNQQQQEIIPSNQSKKRKHDTVEHVESTSATTSTSPKRERLVSSSSSTRGGRGRSKTSRKARILRRKDKWEVAGEKYKGLVYLPELTNKDPLVMRQCYPAVERVTRNGERSQIMIGDCVFVNSTEKYNKPFVAYVNAIFKEDDNDKNIKLWVTWFYRYVDMECPPGPGPEAGEGGGKWPNSYPVAYQNPGGLAIPADEGELFASTHMDNILVGTVHDLCYVISAIQYNNLKAKVVVSKAKENGIAEKTLSARLMPTEVRNVGGGMTEMRAIRSELQETLLDGESKMDDELMFFCRYFYDAFGSKKVRYRTDYMKMLKQHRGGHR